MRKFLLVMLIGIALGMNVYGIINDVVEYFEKDEVVEVHKGYVKVYVE